MSLTRSNSNMLVYPKHQHAAIGKHSSESGSHAPYYYFEYRSQKGNSLLRFNTPLKYIDKLNNYLHSR